MDDNDKLKLTEIDLCYYPTSTIFIDDKRVYLVSLSAYLLNENEMPYYFYDDPQKALNFINNHSQITSWIEQCFKPDPEKSGIGNAVMKLDFSNIHHEIYNPNRFEQITNLVVDYAMPIINGAELCRGIKNKFIIKTLLTGEAGVDEAIKLFNEGLIELYIQKEAPNVVQTLLQGVYQKQQKFFINASQKILSQLQLSSLSCLTNPAFIKLFNQIYQDAKVIEYYLLDEQGSFLFLDKDAKPSWLIMVNEEMMTGYYQFAYYHENVPPSIVEALEKRTHVPFFPTGEKYRAKPPEWEEYLYPAQVLEGKEPYYYAYITEPTFHNLELDKIVSFQKYLDTTYKEYLDKFLVG